jgi:hypothetical protein
LLTARPGLLLPTSSWWLLLEPLALPGRLLLTALARRPPRSHRRLLARPPGRPGLGAAPLPGLLATPWLGRWWPAAGLPARALLGSAELAGLASL